MSGRISSWRPDARRSTTAGVVGNAGLVVVVVVVVFTISILLLPPLLLRPLLPPLRVSTASFRAPRTAGTSTYLAAIVVVSDLAAQA